MKNIGFIVLVALMSFTSCTTSAQNAKLSNSEILQGIVNLEVEDFIKEMKEDNVVILDVRTPKETANGKISNAIEIDVKHISFIEKINKLDKSKKYLVYCRSGRRSVAACEIMEKEGFEKLNNLLGGFNAWKTFKK